MNFDQETKDEQIVGTEANEGEATVTENPPLEAAAVEAVTVEPPKKSKKPIIAGVVAAAVVAAGAIAFTAMNAKDPKETVIEAFENVFPEDQVYPMEEIFGWSDMGKNAMEADIETGFSLKVDNISEESLAMLEGAGFRSDGKMDRANKKSGANVVFTYGGMDFLSVNSYFGDDVLMLSIPELADKVLTLDISDGVVDRVKESPFLGPILSQSGVDLDALNDYVEEFGDQFEEEDRYTLEYFYDRYKEGSKAQENFKAAMVVEKADKKEFTVNGGKVNCNGYNVTINKDAMITFLRESSDFFLNDEELRSAYLKQLEYSVRASQMFGAGSSYMPSSAEELQKKSYEEVKAQVDEMISVLETSLSDIQMLVYVDKKGNLAAIDGTTVLKDEELASEMEVRVQLELQGGAYPTQNMSGTVTMEEPLAEGTGIAIVTFAKSGVSDAKQLTSEIMIDMKNGEEALAGFVCTGTYNKEGKDYHLGMDVVSMGVKVASISASGVVEKLEKGKSIQIAMDELRVGIQEDMYYGTLSGEFYLQPLSGEVKALEGTAMDVIAATESDWQNLLMQAYFGLSGVMQQLDIPMY